MKKGVVVGVVVAAVVLAAGAFPAYEYVEKVVHEEPLRVLFVGDLMLDRNVAVTARSVGAEGLFSSSTLALFTDADVRVANLEGTITTNPSVAERDHNILRFTFAPTLAKRVIELLDLSAVSLANNHALDFGEFGLEDTMLNVEKTGTAYFGHPLNERNLSAVVEAKGKQLCLVGYHSLFSPDYMKVVKEITRLRTDCWRVVVMAHWGDEYETKANTQQREAAHAFIDAGANVVIGAHPHVVEDAEIYQGKAIFYSLGNFMFDQNFSWETTHSLAVRVDFYEGKTAFNLTPMAIVEQHSSVASGADQERILEATREVARFTLP